MLLRLAAYVRRFDLRKKIENLAYQLIENISYQNFDLTILTLDALTDFISLAKNIYEVEPLNARIILREIDTLATEIRKFSGLEKLDNIQSLFPTSFSKTILQAESKPLQKKQTAGGNPLPVDTAIVLPGYTGNTAIRQRNTATGIAELPQDVAIRQSAIIGKIRQSSEKRLRLHDLLQGFPEVSERTLRYDLQRLCDLGKLIRQGSGGPGNYYVLSEGDNQLEGRM